MQGIVLTMKTLVDCQISEVEASDKLLAVIDAMMFVVGIDQAVITAPFVSIDIAL